MQRILPGFAGCGHLPGSRALGRTLDGIPGLLYPIAPPKEGAWTAVAYELARRRKTCGLSDEGCWTLTDAAAEGMELCPAYFGSFPVPPYTPWGWTLRHRALDNGVYWIEASQCKTVLAVCHPIWTTELSDGVTRARKKLAHSRADDMELGYLLFEKEVSCTAIFELLKVRPEWLDAGLIRRPELTSAIWTYAPMYAAAYNAQEQAGLNDTPGLLLQTLGVEDVELKGALECMIAFDPNTGTDFIGFWL